MKYKQNVFKTVQNLKNLITFSKSFYPLNKFNITTWRNISHETKSVDLKLQIV